MSCVVCGECGECGECAVYGVRCLAGQVWDGCTGKGGRDTVTRGMIVFIVFIVLIN